MERLPFSATQLAESYADVGTLPVRVMLHDIRSLYNVGAFFRTADAVGLERLCLSGITGRPPHREISKTALGAEDVGWEACPDVVLYLEQISYRPLRGRYEEGPLKGPSISQVPVSPVFFSSASCFRM